MGKANPARTARLLLRGIASDLPATLRAHRAELEPGSAVWAELSKGKPTLLETGPDTLLDQAAVALLMGKFGLAFRSLARAAAAPSGLGEREKVWSGMFQALARLGEPGAPDISVACDWILASDLGKARPKLGLMALERLAMDKPDDLSIQWEAIGQLLRRKEIERFWPVFDRVISRKNDMERIDSKVISLIAKLPRESLLARLPMMRKPGWSKPRIRLLNVAARQVEISPDRFRRPLLKRSRDLVQVTEDGAAGITAIVFNGLGRTPGAPVLGLDAFLAERGIRAIYLTDEKGTAYVTGAGGCASREETFVMLQGLLNQTPGNRTITIGHSMSAMAAVAYGLNLRVDGALVFSAATTGLASAREAMGEKRGGDFARMTEKLAGEEADLHYWFARIAHRPLVHAHFAAGKPIDRAQAERISQFEGVRLFSAEGHTEHSLPAEMMLRGTFAPALDACLAELPGPKGS